MSTTSHWPSSKPDSADRPEDASHRIASEDNEEPSERCSYRYKCDCNQTFRDKGSLEKHLMQRHKQTLSADSWDIVEKWDECVA
ncbi:hypothetical protein OF83DRAFT_1175555 [Amylostereum chailletii]|nr:hypothetical protein OF83DRAFT_1175555 [Amylostereum chailletii]